MVTKVLGDVTLDIRWGTITNHSNCGMEGFADVRVCAYKTTYRYPIYLQGKELQEFVQRNLDEVLLLMKGTMRRSLWLFSGSVANVTNITSYDTYIYTEQLCCMIETRPDLAFTTRSHVVSNPMHPGRSGVCTWTITPKCSLNPNGVLALGSTPTEFGDYYRGTTRHYNAIASKLRNICRTIGGLRAIRVKKEPAELKR